MEASDLRRIRLFRNLSEKALVEIAGLAVEASFARGEIIFEEGTPGDRFYLISHGEVRISQNLPGIGDEALAILSNGESFGEMSLIDDAPRSADAIAVTECLCYVIRRKDLESLLGADKALAHDLLWCFVRSLSARLRETNAKMTFLASAGKFI